MVKNIVIVSQYYAPAWSYGGPPRVLHTLAGELLKQGKNIKVITTDVLDEGRNPFLTESLDGIEIIRLKTVSNYLAYKMKLIIAAGALEKSEGIIRQSDFILFSDVRAIINWQLYPFVSDLKIPYGIFAFGQVPHGDGVKAQVKKMMDYLWVRDFMRKAAYKFAQTPHEQEMYRQFFHIPLSKSQLLPLPVETCHPDKVPIQSGRVEGSLADASSDKLRDSSTSLGMTTNSFKKKWHIKNDDKVLLYVGRLHYLKGVDLLISAVMPLLQNDPRLKLLIVGRDDGQEQKLRNLAGPQAGKQIIFTGALYEKNVFCAYKLASCFVITPRFYEETSLAALEALSFGVPVIVSKQADIPYLEKYHAGYVVHNDSDSIKKAVIRMLEKLIKDRGQVNANSQKLISEKFSASMVAKKLLSIIDKNQYE